LLLVMNVRVAVPEPFFVRMMDVLLKLTVYDLPHSRVP
jgi:hypothetical protein